MCSLARLREIIAGGLGVGRLVTELGDWLGWKRKLRRTGGRKSRVAWGVVTDRRADPRGAVGGHGGDAWGRGEWCMRAVLSCRVLPVGVGDEDWEGSEISGCLLEVSGVGHDDQRL